MVIKNTGSWIDVDWIQFDLDGYVSSVEDVNAPVAIGPNPASTEVKVYGVDPISVEIISTEGIVVKKSSEDIISVADLQEGNYIIRIVTDNGVIVKKLVVAK